MRSRTIGFVFLLAVLTTVAGGGLARPAAPEAAAPPTKIFDNGNVAAVQNGASAPTIFTTTQEWKIVQIYTYHWNNAKGATPGMIGLTSLTTNKKYGPWQATGAPGQGGVPNAYWIVAPKIDIPAGKYQITDSSPATWSQNSGTGGAGMVMVMALPGGFAWPALPSGEVPLATVANGCGPGTASSDPRWGDTSVYTGKHLVNFRMACNLHDAGYSGARVKDPLHGNRIVDYFTWSQTRVDDKFLDDMREICDDRIRPGTPSATEALAQCKGRGGTLTIGAVTRHNAVRTVGKWVFLDRPRLSGVWANEADPTEPALALSQVVRAVKGSWRGGKADPGSRAEFRGTLISRDTDSIVRGYVKYTDGTGAVSLKTMTITVDPESPNRIVVAGPGSISGARARR